LGLVRPPKMTRRLQDLRNIRRLAPPTPQFWGELDLVPPKVGGLALRVRKS
jgi:hypothetical protein